MIVLRKLGGEQGTTSVIADPLIGVKNGVNQVFNTNYEYIKDRITIFYNGQALHSPDDFIQSGPTEIIFVHVFPIENSEIRGLYETIGSSGTSKIDHGQLAGLDDDDHPQYHTNERGDSRYYTQDQIDTISGSLYQSILNHHDTFLDLLDTPATYSGNAGKYVRVKDDGQGLEFSEVQDEFNGKEPINSGVTSVFVHFSTAVTSTDYTINVTLENTIDVEPSIFSTLVSNTTTSGFTVLFSGDIDSSNYKLNWMAKL